MLTKKNSEGSKELLSYLLSQIFSNFSVTMKEDDKNVYLKVIASKNDYNFITRNKVLLTSIRAITMAYGAKINKKIHINFVLNK